MPTAEPRKSELSQIDKETTAMRFGSKQVPGRLFKLARDRMLRETTFTPEEIRQYLLEQSYDVLRDLSPIQANHRIIANRVMHDCLNQLVDSGEIAQLNHGVWAKTKILTVEA